MKLYSKANGFLLTIGFFILSIQGATQTWKYSITPDYEFSVCDQWGELGGYEARFVMHNQKATFESEIDVEDDHWGRVMFPDSFNLVRGDINLDSLVDFNWYIEVKKHKVASGNLTYDSSPNSIFQLHPFDPFPVKDQLDLWGEVVDAFTWEDKTGENFFIRTDRCSYNEVVLDADTVAQETVHLYFYHYRMVDGKYELVRKLTDYVKLCTDFTFANHVIESIELTDVDRDTIAEVSFLYDVDCIKGIEPNKRKLMMLSDGRKYAVRGTAKILTSHINKEYKGGEYIPGNELSTNLVFKRFMIKKWENNLIKTPTVESSR